MTLYLPMSHDACRSCTLTVDLDAPAQARATLWSSGRSRSDRPMSDVAGEAEPYPPLLYPYQSTAKSPHDHVLSCTAHSTPSIVRMVYVWSHFLAQYMQIAARGSCSELRPWWAAKIPHRPATAHPHAPGAGPKLGQNEACAQPGRAPPEATQAAPNQPCDEPRRSHAVEVIPARASATCGLELAALLAHGAIHAAEVHDHVVAWFGLQCGAAVPEGAGQSTRM